MVNLLILLIIQYNKYKKISISQIYTLYLFNVKIYLFILLNKEKNKVKKNIYYQII